MELIDTPGNPCPPGGNIVGLRARDGVQLRAAYWRPQGIPRGTVALIHGRAEFIEKYYEVIGEFLARGFVVATFDWRGQGLSQRLLRNRLKGHVQRSSDYRLDLDAFLHQLLARDCPKPWFALAHSMGASALLDHAGSSPDALPFERIVGTSPMLGLSGFAGSDFARQAAATLSALGLGGFYAPGGGPRTLAQIPFANNILSRDRCRFQRAGQVLSAAPALGIGDPTIGWAHAAYELMGRLNSGGFAEAIRTPALFLAAGNERLTSSPAVEIFARRMKNAACVVLQNSEHEIMMERDEVRAKFWAAFDAFIPGEPFLHEADSTRAMG